MTQNMQQHYGSAQSNDVAKPAVAADAPLAATTLPGLCVELRRKVLAFLEEPPEDETVRRTQEQTRISLQVVEEALKRYKYVSRGPVTGASLPSGIAG
jgi:FAD synthetase